MKKRTDSLLRLLVILIVSPLITNCDGTFLSKGQSALKGSFLNPEQDPSKSQFSGVPAPKIGKACKTLPDVGHTTLQRLNKTEYLNSVRDLFEMSHIPSLDLPEDGFGNGFNNDSDVLFVNKELISAYLTAGEAAVEQAFSESRSKIMTCLETTAACASEILGRLAEKAYRRPLSFQELGAVMNLTTQAESLGLNFEARIKMALRGILISPQFLFRSIGNARPGLASSTAVLNDFELASRLSYFLWSSLPDSELMAAAKQGRLKSSSELRSQVNRMLKDSKASALTENFGSQWLLLHRMRFANPDPGRYPSFDAQLREDMVGETKAFFSNIVTNDLPATEILTAKYSFINKDLAKVYEVSGVSGSSLRRVDLSDLSSRGGVLTHPSILTITSSDPEEPSIVHRGKFVLNNLLCDMPPPPPDNLPVLPGSEADRSAGRLSRPRCAACHGSMDRIGGGLFSFDAIGKLRTTDNTGAPISTSAQLPDGRVFNGASELASIIAQDVRFKACLARKLATYALGRDIRNYNLCSVYKIGEATVGSDKRLSELIHGIVQSDLFLKQRGGQP